MNKISQIRLVASIVVVLATSCGRTYDPGPEPVLVENKTQLNKLFAPIRSTPQDLTVQAGIYQTIYGAKGTKLTFYSNSFKDASGNVITSGTINIKLVEMYKPGEMIADRALTISNGNLLQSGGQVYMEATKGGQEVYANVYGIGFQQPAASTQPMMLYYGNTKNEDSVATWSTDTNKVRQGTFAEWTTKDTSGSTKLYYQFDSCTNFKWINCDYFYASTAPKTNIVVSLPDNTFNASNTTVYFVFPAVNATSIGYYGTDVKVFTGMNFPTGMNVSVVVMAIKDGTYYYFEQKGVTISAGMVVKAEMAQQSLNYVKTKLKEL